MSTTRSLDVEAKGEALEAKSGSDVSSKRRLRPGLAATASCIIILVFVLGAIAAFVVTQRRNTVSTVTHIVVETTTRVDVYIDSNRSSWHIIRHEQNIYRHIVRTPTHRYSFTSETLTGPRSACVEDRMPSASSISAEQLGRLGRLDGDTPSIDGRTPFLSGPHSASREYAARSDLFAGCEDLRLLLTAQPPPTDSSHGDCAICEMEAELEAMGRASGLDGHSPRRMTMLLDVYGEPVVAFMDVHDADVPRWHLVSNASAISPHASTSRTTAVLHHTVYDNGTLYRYETNREGAPLTCHVHHGLPRPTSPNLTLMELMSLHMPNVTNLLVTTTAPAAATASPHAAAGFVPYGVCDAPSTGSVPSNASSDSGLDDRRRLFVGSMSWPTVSLPTTSIANLFGSTLSLSSPPRQLGGPVGRNRKIDQPQQRAQTGAGVTGAGFGAVVAWLSQTFLGTCAADPSTACIVITTAAAGAACAQGIQKGEYRGPHHRQMPGWAAGAGNPDCMIGKKFHEVQPCCFDDQEPHNGETR